MDDNQHLLNESYSRNCQNACVDSVSSTTLVNQPTADVTKIVIGSSHQQLQETKYNSVNNKSINSKGIDDCEIIKADVDKCNLIIKTEMPVNSPMPALNNSDNILINGNNEMNLGNNCSNIDIYEDKSCGLSHSIKEESQKKKPFDKYARCSAMYSLVFYGDSSDAGDDDDDDDDDAVSSRDICEGQNTNFNNEVVDDPNSRSKDFVDMSLRFPRSQQIIDDDLLSLSSSSSSDSSTSLIFSVNSDVSDDDYDDEFDSSDENGNEGANKNKKNNKTAVAEGNNKKASLRKIEKQSKTEGELSLEDLPVIKDLHITVPKEECVLLGNILNIVDKLVMVQALKDLPALDLDTVLFLEWDKPLGKVFDVIGPVSEPLYCIRFNSKEHVQAKNISVGMPVYFVPKFKGTKYVFVAQLMKMKGSDASWENNNEPPLEFLEYSDDEQERQAKKYLKKIGLRKKKQSADTEQKHPTPYEKRMNKRNLKMSEMKMRQSRNKKSRKQHSQIIRPSTFMVSEPDGAHSMSSSSLVNSAIDIKPFTDFGKSFPASHQDVNYNVPFNSPRLPNCSASVSHQLFQPHFNPNHNVFPYRPSQWSIPPATFNMNTFAYPQQSPNFSQGIFSSPPPRFPCVNFTPEKPIISPSLTSFPPFNDFSSPPPNFSNSNPRFSSFPGHSEPRINPSQSLFSPFSSFSGNNEMTSPSFYPTTPPNSTNLFSSQPPPVSLPQNVNHHAMNVSNTLPFSNSFNRNLVSDSGPPYGNSSNISRSSLRGRLPIPPQQNFDQNHMTFWGNSQ